MRLISLLPRLYLPAIVVMCVGYAWRSIHGTDDFWAHAAVGRWMWQHHAVPHQTLFLWGRPPIPWIAHSWLTQLTFYGLMALGGENGGPFLALILTAAIATFTFVLLYSRVWLRHARATILLPPVFILAIWLASPRFHPRPELFSALFLTLLLVFVVEWHRRSPRNPHLEIATPLGLFVLFMVWANFHGGVAMGLAVLLIALCGDALQDGLVPRTRLLAALLLVCILAVCFNPYGLAYWTALKPVTSTMFSDIDEWKPFWKYPVMTMSFVYGAGLMVAATLVIWALNPARRLTHLLWVLFIAASFVMQRRHLWTLAELCLVVIAVNIAVLDTERLWELWCRLTRAPASRGEAIPAGLRLIARLGVTACLGIGVAKAIASDVLPLRAVAHDLPRGLAHYVKANHVPEPVMNDYESSSYLLWRCGGKPRLYIDLLNAYPGQLLADYFDVLDANKHGLQILETNRVQTVSLRKHETTEGMHVLAQHLDADKRSWKRVYAQDDGTIWVRAVPWRQGR